MVARLARPYLSEAYMESQVVPLEVLKAAQAQANATKEEAATLRSRADELDQMADLHLMLLRTLIAQAVPLPVRPLSALRTAAVSLPERVAADTSAAPLFTTDAIDIDDDEADVRDDDGDESATAPMPPNALRGIIITTVDGNPGCTRRELVRLVKEVPVVTSSSKSVSNTIRDMARKDIIVDIDGRYYPGQ